MIIRGGWKFPLRAEEEGMNGGYSGRRADELSRWRVGAEKGEAHRVPRRFLALRTHDCVHGGWEQTGRYRCLVKQGGV